MEALDFKNFFNYVREWFLFFDTEATEKWSILYHATKEAYGAAHDHTPARHRDLFRQASGRSAGPQYQDDLRGDRGRQAPSQENRQAVSYHAGSGTGVFREFAVRKEAEVNTRHTSCMPIYRHKKSASSEVSEARRTDATLEGLWHKYTSCRPNKQRP